MRTIHPTIARYIGFAETSLAHAGNPEAREYFINNVRSTYPKEELFTKLLFRAASRHSRLVEHVIGRKVPEGMSRIGAGWESICYTNGSFVIKVDKASAGMSEAERRGVAAKLQHDHAVLVSYLGSSAVLPQTVDVGPHPANKRQQVVMTEQPHAVFIPLDPVFPAAGGNIDKVVLDQLFTAYPNIKGELSDLASNSLMMAAETKLVPDIGGMGNIGLVGASNTVTMIDAIPQSAELGWVQERLIPQLYDLYDHCRSDTIDEA
ncbi:MAG TPA: hypothetical protein VF572_01290 [Candidatus Saccharimonadales bacterium]